MPGPRVCRMLLMFLLPDMTAAAGTPPAHGHGMDPITSSRPVRGGRVDRTGATVRILNVPVLAQFPRHPTGCEAVALTMLLQWAGKQISVDTVIAQLPQGPVPRYRDGILHGPDPREVFVGSPYDGTHSFGVFHQPLLRLLERHFPGHARNLTGQPWEAVERQVAAGIPVVVWATIRMLPVKSTVAWKIPDGTLFRWPGNEHALLVTGFTAGLVLVNDPWTGKQEQYPAGLFRQRWRELGSQALSLAIPETNRSAAKGPP